jgi:Lrp/AsnC family leucine-responsive transcriptional regulator
MNELDRIFCEIMQVDGKASLSNIAQATGIPTSTANDRLRRLNEKQIIRGVHASLTPEKVGAGLCCFLLIDMDYDGEQSAIEILSSRMEIMELHHISGAHTYLAKVRVKDMSALQNFLSKVIKPLKGITNTETIFAMKTIKETSEMLISE